MGLRQPRAHIETLSSNTDSSEWSPYSYRIREKISLSSELRSDARLMEFILSESGNVVLSKLLPGPQLFQDDSDSQVSTLEPRASQPWHGQIPFTQNTTKPQAWPEHPQVKEHRDSRENLCEWQSPLCCGSTQVRL